MPFPMLVGAFFFAAWLAMVFWGMVAPDVGLSTIGYPKAMLITIGLWLVVFPLARPMAKGGRLQVMGTMGRERSRGRDNDRERGPDSEWQTVGDHTINISSSFSGMSRRITSQTFIGGTVTTNFGGVRLDLTQAKPSYNGARLSVRAFVGGIEIIVPEDWHVEFDISAFLGGVSDERSRPGSRAASSPRLAIAGSATLGGVTVKDR